MFSKAVNALCLGITLLLTHNLYSQTNPDTLRLNQIQTLGSHNSYRIHTDKGIFGLMKLLDPFYGVKTTPAQALDYNHIPIPEQFENYGMRGLELDIHYDPNGGLFYKRKGNALVLKCTDSKVEALKKKGMKILHISDIDYNTHYITFIDALEAVKQWSDSHPMHLPIYIMVEPKEEGVGNKLKGLGFVEVLPFDKTALEAVDDEIRLVFKDDLKHILTPDDVRGNYPTLFQAITKGGWPKLKDARGKIIFVINGSMANTIAYADGHPSFTGRMMFSLSQPGRDEAAFLKSDNPGNPAIQDWVKSGYIVRSRCDEPGVEALHNDYSTMHKAFECGSQILSTDYYKPDLNLSTYKAAFPDGKVAKTNFLIPAEMSKVLDWKEK